MKDELTGVVVARLKPQFPEFADVKRFTFNKSGHPSIVVRCPVATKKDASLVFTEEVHVPPIGVICVCGVCQLCDALGLLSRRFAFAQAKGLKLPEVSGSGKRSGAALLLRAG